MSRRKPGSRWRVLAHDDGKRVELRDRGVVDELVIDDWLHLEQLNARTWCLVIGSGSNRVMLDVTPTSVYLHNLDRFLIRDGKLEPGVHGA